MPSPKYQTIDLIQLANGIQIQIDERLRQTDEHGINQTRIIWNIKATNPAGKVIAYDWYDSMENSFREVLITSLNMVQQLKDSAA